ncbi:MAG: hypothetical protein Q8Q09_18830 [Deltaproteobacteria bacterium]|nr:hypothetical protein [Deltaproteobacteria bacterium]
MSPAEPSPLPPAPLPLRRDALLGALALGLAWTPALYALVRVGQHLLGPEPSPLAVLSSERSYTHERLMLTGYALALALAGCVALARRWPKHSAGATQVGAVLSGLAIAAQAGWLP